VQLLCVEQGEHCCVWVHFCFSSAAGNKSVYLSANRDLLKVPPIQNNCPFLQTVASFWKLLSKDRFPKLQDFALKIHSLFGSTRGGERIFYTIKQVKSKIEWQTKHWTIASDCYH